MEHAKHTPGPWFVDAPDCLVYAKSINEYVATTDVEGFGLIPAEVISANARLIAAAPELLEALIAFRDGGAGKNFDGWHESYRPAIDKARAAIAKALGQEGAL